MCYGSFKGKGIEHCGGKSNEGSSHQWRGKDKTTGLAAAMGISGLDGNSRLNGNLVKLYLIKGRVEVRAGAETFSLDATDALAIPGGLSHQIHNSGIEDAELIISYSTGDREYAPE